MPLCRTVVLLLLLLGLSACDRRLEPYVPPEQEPPPPLTPVRVPGLEQPAPRAQPRAASMGAQTISGTLRLASGVTVSSGAVLFVIAYPIEGGPPLAVKRLAPGAFPLEFVIGVGDFMQPGAHFAGPVRLSVRMDLDGDPLTREPGAAGAEAPGPVEPGTSDLELVLEAPRG